MRAFKNIFLVPEYRFLLIVLLIFSLLRLPSLFEPNWYGDEGIYQVLGNAINHGRMLYQDIWDNKPPLLYLTYAVVQSDHFAIRVLAYLAGILGVFGMFLLTRTLFRKSTAVIVATSVFAFLFAIPTTEATIANAENFMLVFIIFAGLLIFRYQKGEGRQNRRRLLFTAGLLLSVAFLYKIVAVFDFAAFLLFLVFLSLPERITHRDRKELLQRIWVTLPYVVGFSLPILITALYFIFNQAFISFISATLSSNVSYVGWKNTLFIPQGLLITKVALLILSVFILFRIRTKLSPASLFVLLWVVFSLFSLFFSQRPYTHYILVAISSYSLLVGLTVGVKKYRLPLGMLLILISLVAYSTFNIIKPKKLIAYYQNFLSFVTMNKSIHDYHAFFDPDVPRDYEIAQYLRSHLQDGNDSIFMWGNTAQIYALSGTLPPGKYAVQYHIGSQRALDETQEAIDTKKPKFIILLPDSPAPQLSLNSYLYHLTIGDVAIYQRVP